MMPLAQFSIEVPTMNAPEGDNAMPPAQPQADAPIIQALQSVYDPELPTNIYDLGLIYSVETPTPGQVEIKMTLTAPACPVAGTLPGEVQRAVEAVEGVERCQVDLVWQPPWTKERMSEEARLQLGLF
jgi:FeS assembly SUF system protein